MHYTGQWMWQIVGLLFEIWNKMLKFSAFFLASNGC